VNGKNCKKKELKFLLPRWRFRKEKDDKNPQKRQSVIQQSTGAVRCPFNRQPDMVACPCLFVMEVKHKKPKKTMDDDRCCRACRYACIITHI
jgi:hypothetical protein